MSLALGIGTIVGSAFVPVIYLELLSVFGGSWAIALYIVAAGVISFAASAILQRLTRRRGVLTETGQFTEKGQPTERGISR